MRIARAVLKVLRLAVAHERLDPAPPASAAPPGKAHGVLHLLFVSREPLGFDPEPPRPRRRSLLRALLAPEELPRDPHVAPAPRRRGRLAALLLPEKLDP